MAEQEIYYEMLWDCTQCDAKALLGESHRHCPTCGAAQDPTKRYFPKPGDEVEARNHQFVGADWRCVYCNSPNSAAAAHCTNCGAGKDGTKPVALVQDNAAEPTPALQPRPRTSTWLRRVTGIIVLAVLAVVAMFLSTHDSTATVSGRNWQREIQIERLVSVTDSAWCDSVPSDAYSVSRSREQRSSRKVPDGQVCHEERVDKGDGTFVKHQECVPRYREEPVYDDRCHFQVNRWRSVRSVTANATTAQTPVWPSVGPLGAEREGARSEHYVLTLTAPGKTWTCDVAERVWSQYPEGSTASVKVRMTGGVDCASLR